MQQLGVISPVQEPTEWCSGMVVVSKTNGQVRICIDLTRLNESVQRELHLIPAVEQKLAQIAGAKFFSKLDCNSGFWQIPLSKDSALLTTFITPFGRYYFNRLPFGIMLAPEHFQRRTSTLLGDLEGHVGLIDNTLIYVKTKEEHNARLYAVLERLLGSGLTLNREKCKFSMNRVKFLGQILTASGVESDPEKVSAIHQIKITNVGDVRRFLGMANQLSKFVPNLANPLRDLLSKDALWCWDQPQKEAFAIIKRVLTMSPVLALFDPSKETIVSADASSFGLGAVLYQKEQGKDSRLVAYVSRAMMPTEQRYAQIKKEVTWACEIT